MRLNDRLSKLERRMVGGADCPGCGFPKDGSTPSHVTLIIPAPRVFGEDKGPIDHSSDFCRVCGRRMKFYIPSPKEIVAGV